MMVSEICAHIPTLMSVNMKTEDKYLLWNSAGI